MTLNALLLFLFLASLVASAPQLVDGQGPFPPSCREPEAASMNCQIPRFDFLLQHCRAFEQAGHKMTGDCSCDANKIMGICTRFFCEGKKTHCGYLERDALRMKRDDASPTADSDLKPHFTTCHMEGLFSMTFNYTGLQDRNKQARNKNGPCCDATIGNFGHFYLTCTGIDRSLFQYPQVKSYYESVGLHLLYCTNECLFDVDFEKIYPYMLNQPGETTFLSLLAKLRPTPTKRAELEGRYAASTMITDYSSVTQTHSNWNSGDTVPTVYSAPTYHSTEPAHTQDVPAVHSTPPVHTHTIPSVHDEMHIQFVLEATSGAAA